MKSLKSILRRYDRGVTLGEGEAALNKKPIIADLQRLRKSKDWAFFICVGMVVLAFLISIGLVLTLIQEPDKITILFGATGLTTAGLISVMRGIWKEKVAIEMTIALLERTPPESLASVLAELIKKF
jgi:hypothetical protein